MDMTSAPALPGAPVPARRATTAAEDTLSLVAGLWLLTGTYVDGWAHNNLAHLETFFTPWHAVLYSGFAANAVWIGFLVWRRRRRGSRWMDAVPAGYGGAAIGVVLFLVSGVADLAWHSVFGIEQDIKALFSPSHLGLATGGFLILGAPFAAATAASPGRTTPARLTTALVSAALCGMVAIFILQEFAVFARHGLIQTYGPPVGGVRPVLPATSASTIVALGSFLVSTAALFVPILLAASRWRLPALVPALLTFVPSVALQAMVAFRDARLVLAAAVGAALVGLTWLVLRPRPDRPVRLRAAAAVAPPLFWGPYFAAVASADGRLSFSPEIWAGVLVWTALETLAIAALLVHRRPDALEEP
ncbi:hypothetical protein J2X81_003434 [Sinomonas atrocyanea]|nr:hypothetical protein [Sinomonas atrocyanea]